MAFEIEAVFEDGVFKPKHPTTLTEGAEVRLLVREVESREVDPATDSSPSDEDDPLRGLIGICDGEGPTDGAENHDDYLYGKMHP